MKSDLARNEIRLASNEMAFHSNPWLLTNVPGGTSQELKKLVSYGKNIYNFFFRG